MVLQNTGKYRADREDSSKKDAGTSSGARFVVRVKNMSCTNYFFVRIHKFSLRF